MHKGAGAIIYHRNLGKVLLVKGTQGIYSFPKGHYEGRETAEECAIREVYEETGMNLNLHTLLHCPKTTVFNYVYFFVSLDGPEPLLCVHDTREVDKVVWYDINDNSIWNQCNQGVKKVVSNWNFYAKRFLGSWAEKTNMAITTTTTSVKSNNNSNNSNNNFSIQNKHILSYHYPQSKRLFFQYI